MLPAAVLLSSSVVSLTSSFSNSIEQGKSESPKDRKSVVNSQL